MPDVGEPINRNEIVLNKEMGYVDKLIGWARRHPYLSAAGLITILLGGGLALGQLYKSRNSDGTAAVSVISADSPTLALAQTPAPTPVQTVANATAKEHIFDYYDEEFKIGIMIEGSPTDKKNVSNLLKYFKERTPDFYADVISYAPKKIIESPNSASWYGGPKDEDSIELPRGIIDAGGSNNKALLDASVITI